MKKGFFICIMTLLAVGVAVAQSQTGGKRGQIYLGLNLFAGENIEGLSGMAPTGAMYGSTAVYQGSTLVSDMDLLTVCVNAEVGLFLADGFQLGIVLVQQSVMQLGSTSGANAAVELIGLGADVGYDLDLGGLIVPFAQLNGYFMIRPGDRVFLGFKVMPIVGVKVFASANAAIDVGAFYSYSAITEANVSAPERIINNYFGLRVGVDLFL